MPVTLKPGDDGELVRRLQQTLVGMGYDLGRGGADGKYGDRTRKAIISFQGTHGLPGTGVADPATISSLSLDPDTLEDMIEMDEEEPSDQPNELTDDAARVIEDFADTQADFNNDVAESLQNAIENFETVIQQASTKEARADVLGSVLSKLADSLINDVLGEAAKTISPWFKAGKFLLSGLQAASAESARAEAARRSVDARDWITRQRKTLDSIRWGRADRATIREQAEAAYQQAADPQSHLRILAAARAELVAQRADNVGNRALLASELTLYETWINAHFTGTGGPGSGYALIIFNTERYPWQLKPTRLYAPYEDKITDYLNQLMTAVENDKSKQRIRPDMRPFVGDLRIHKFIVFGGDHSDFYDALEAPDVMRPMMLQMAYKKWGAFCDPDYRPLTTPTDSTSRKLMEGSLDAQGRVRFDLVFG